MRIIDRLLYLSSGRLPDVGVALQPTTRYLGSSTCKDFLRVKRILRPDRSLTAFWSTRRLTYQADGTGARTFASAAISTKCEIKFDRSASAPLHEKARASLVETGTTVAAFARLEPPGWRYSMSASCQGGQAKTPHSLHWWDGSQFGVIHYRPHQQL